MENTLLNNIKEALDSGFLVLTAGNGTQIGEVNCDTGKVFDNYSDEVDEPLEVLMYELEEATPLCNVEMEDVLDVFREYSRGVYEFESSLSSNPYKEVTLLETESGDIVWELDPDYSYGSFHLNEETLEFFKEVKLVTYNLVEDF